MLSSWPTTLAFVACATTLIAFALSLKKLVVKAVIAGFTAEAEAVCSHNVRFKLYSSQESFYL
jgi:hypothetical protein